MNHRILAIFALAIGMAVPATADAFCGFYVGGAGSKLFNNATEVVMMRHGTKTVLSMANNYQGPAEDFAMVVPVPVVLQKENVKTLSKRLFERVDTLASPRLVQYWEQNPCPVRMRGGFGKRPMRMKKSAPRSARAERERPRPKVRIEAQFEVGEYEIVILSADEALALDEWLRQGGYNIPQGAEKVLRPYVASGMKFFVAKVNIKKVAMDKSGKTMLSPLRFHYDSQEFSLPIRLGLLNSQGAQDLIVHILAMNQRYEVANYENVTIPTNIYLRKKTLKHFRAFYATLFDRTLEKNPGAVVTEYSWQATKCDPCPGPAAALTAAELTTLGADVIGGGQSQPRRGRGRMMMGWTLTRLHARYTADSLGEDLVFRAAPGIVGGREFRPKGKRLEQGSSPSGVNNFQARYIMRHKWTGPVTCKNPQWGMWGGPPGGGNGLQIANDTAFTKNRKLNLRNYVLQRVPEIGLRPRWSRKKKSPKSPAPKPMSAPDGTPLEAPDP